MPGRQPSVNWFRALRSASRLVLTPRVWVGWALAGIAMAIATSFGIAMLGNDSVSTVAQGYTRVGFATWQGERVRGYGVERFRLSFEKQFVSAEAAEFELTALEDEFRQVAEGGLRGPDLQVDRSLVPGWSSVAGRLEHRGERTVTLVEQANGWPLLCVTNGLLATDRIMTSFDSANPSAFDTARRLENWGRSLPTRVLWWRLAANALILAVAGLTLHRGARLWLVLMRIRRCACVACGYSRAGLGSAPCPECGVVAR